MALNLSPKAAILTLGCAKNEADSRAMAEKLRAASIDVVDDMDAADVVIVNTCGFIQSAAEESIDAILEVLDSDRVRAGELRVVVAGCLPSRYGKDLAESLPEVSAFAPCDEEDAIASIVGGLEIAPRSGQSANRESVAGDFADDAAGGAFAYVKISEGCDRRCSFCAIPSIRGRYRSFSAETIAEQVEKLRAEGAREIDLIAQDTGVWGCDLHPRQNLAMLLDHLCERFDDLWFRVLYIQPDAVDDDLIRCFKTHENLCDYLDIPIQHVDGALLRSMGRRGDGEAFAKLCARLRTELPGVALRTTVIVGYPGETEEQFQALLDFVAEGHFDYVGAFPFSAEEGTAACELPGQVPEEEKLARWQQLRDVADEVGAAGAAAHIGEVTSVLIDGQEEDGQCFGRASWQAPEVDGVTFTPDHPVGSWARVAIVDSFGYDLEGDDADER